MEVLHVQLNKQPFEIVDYVTPLNKQRRYIEANNTALSIYYYFTPVSYDLLELRLHLSAITKIERVHLFISCSPLLLLLLNCTAIDAPTTAAFIIVICDGYVNEHGRSEIP